MGGIVTTTRFFSKNQNYWFSSYSLSNSLAPLPFLVRYSCLKMVFGRRYVCVFSFYQYLGIPRSMYLLGWRNPYLACFHSLLLLLPPPHPTHPPSLLSLSIQHVNPKIRPPLPLLPLRPPRSNPNDLSTPQSPSVFFSPIDTTVSRYRV